MSDWVGVLEAKVKERQLKNLDIQKKKSQRELNRKEILRCIIRSEPDGISTNALERETGLNHDTVSNHCKDLTQELIITKSNKKSRYHLTGKAYGDPYVRARLFNTKILKSLRERKIPLDKENLFCSISENDLNKDNHDKLMLFSLANTVGAVMVYAMMEAIKPGMWKPRIKRKIMEDTSGKNKDAKIKEWIKDVLDPIVFFREFLELNIVRNGLPINNPRFWKSQNILKKLPPETKRRLKENAESRRLFLKQIAAENKRQRELRKFEPAGYNRSAYEMDRINFKKLVKVFQEVYPLQFSALKDATIE